MNSFWFVTRLCNWFGLFALLLFIAAQLPSYWPRSGLILLFVFYRVLSSSLRVGDAVELRRADGSSLVTEIKAFPMVCPFDERWVPISFPAQVSKEDVPVGAEVWSYT